MLTFSRRGLRVILLAACPLAFPAVAAAAAGAPTAITAVPALQPAFDPAIADYVTRCTGAPVQLSVGAPADATVAVDGDGPRSGTFGRDVALDVNRAFSFTVAGATTRTYHVRCLPADFPPYTAQRSGTPQASQYLVTPDLAIGAFPAGYSQGYAAFFDNGGAPVWWYQAPSSPVDAKLLPNGHVAWNVGGAQGGMEERRLDGSLVRALNTAGHGSDLHDLQLLPNGNYLLPIYQPIDHGNLSAIGGPADVTIIDAVVQELTPAGDLVWEWHASEHILPQEIPVSWRGPVLGGGAPYDVYHLNSIEKDGAGLVISFRVLDAVYKVAGSGSGAVEWKLGGVDVPGTSLAVIGDPVLTGEFPDPSGPLAGQHDARILPGGDITIHDNGTHLVAGVWSGRRPRAVRFAIDEAAKTATFVSHVTDPNVPRSVCCGGARNLPGGNWVLSWGGTGQVTELTGDGTRVFSLDFQAPIFSYRANPILPGRLSPAALRWGMDERFGRSALSIGGAAPDLGSVVATRQGHERTFVITSSGDGAVTIGHASLSGDGAFQVVGGDCDGRTLAPGETCAMRIRLAPETLGTRTATLRVTSDAASSPNEAVLTGAGVVAPPVTTTPPPVTTTPPPAGDGDPPASFVRATPSALTIGAGCRRLDDERVRCTITSGALRPAASVGTLDRAAVCSGSVRVRYLARERIVAARRLALSTACRYRGAATFALARGVASRLGAQARYDGNAVSLPKRSRMARVAIR